MSKTIVFEASGIVYALGRQRRVVLTVADNATWEDVIAALARAVPALVGDVIGKDRRHLVSDYLINVGGRVTIQDLSAIAEIAEGEQFVLLSDLC